MALCTVGGLAKSFATTNSWGVQIIRYSSDFQVPWMLHLQQHHVASNSHDWLPVLRLQSGDLGLEKRYRDRHDFQCFAAHYRVLRRCRAELRISSSSIGALCRSHSQIRSLRPRGVRTLPSRRFEVDYNKQDL